MPCIRSRSTRSGGRSRDRCRALRPTDARSRPSRKAIRRPASPVLPGLWRFRGPSPAWRGRGRMPADHKVKCGASGLGAEATPGPNLSRRFAHNLRDAFSIRVRKSKSAIEAAGEPAISRRPPPRTPQPMHTGSEIPGPGSVSVDIGNPWPAAVDVQRSGDAGYGRDAGAPSRMEQPVDHAGRERVGARRVPDAIPWTPSTGGRWRVLPGIPDLPPAGDFGRGFPGDSIRR